MDYDLEQFSERHRDAAKLLRVGEPVSLFSLDEDTDDESRPFLAVVDGIRHREPPLITFIVQHADEALVESVAEVLKTCAKSPQSYLHVGVRWREGALVRTYSPGFLLKLLAPNGPEHEFVVVELGTVGEARRMNAETYTLRFAAELLD